MKQITTITAIFLVNGLFLSSASAQHKPIPFAGGLNQGGKQETKGFGAPNKVSEEGPSKEKQGRVDARQPNPSVRKSEETPTQGGGQRTQGPNDNEEKELTRPAVVPKGGPLYNDPEVAEAIGLTEQQAEELRKVHEFAIKRLGEVMSNGQLTEEQRQGEIDGIKSTQKARRGDILTAEQLAALEKLHKGAKEYKGQQAGMRTSAGKPMTKGQKFARATRNSKGEQRLVPLASVFGPAKQNEIIIVNEKFRGEFMAAYKNYEKEILAIKESAKASILTIKEDPELEAEDKKQQLVEIKEAKELQIAASLEATKLRYVELEIEQGEGIREVLGEEEYETYKNVRAHNIKVRGRMEKKPKQKGEKEGGTDSKGRPEKVGAGFEKKAKEYEEMAQKMRSEGHLDQSEIYSKLARIKWAGAKRGKLTEEELKQYHNLREQLAKLKNGGTDSKGRPENGDTDSKGRPGNDGGSEQAKKYPSHWGEPPAKQTKDRVQLPGNYGEGSSTLFRWIKKHMEEDAKKRQEKGGNE